MISILALVAAGKVREDDDILSLMQGVSLEHSKSIADWLVLATDGPVHLQWTTVGEVVDIRRTPAEVAATIRRPQPGA